MKHSEFNDWFVAQHGERAKAFWGHTDLELVDIANRGDAARDELGRRQVYDERKESALYAWQVKHGK